MKVVGMSPEARIFVQAALGRQEPITEADFTPAELARLDAIIRGAQQKGASRVTYQDYGPSPQDMALARTLGMFSIGGTPQAPEARDTYDFHNWARDLQAMRYERMNPFRKAQAVFAPTKRDAVADPDLASRFADAYMRDVSIPVRVRTKR